MHLSLTSFRNRLIESLLQFLWRQWSALGVAGYAGSRDPWIVDPEALLLFSLPIARHDPRLFDEIIDWLHISGHWVNLQRLQTLGKEYRLGQPTLLAPIARKLATTSAHGKWKVLDKAAPPEAPEKAATPVFEGIPVTGTPDADFLGHGWQRGQVELRGMSQQPRPDQPATFLFKLRALFGRQNRAEIIAWLLTHEHGHPAEIARQTGCYPRSAQLVLNELAASGHIRSFRVGREKQFSITHADWRFLLTWSPADSFPLWVGWAPLFQVVQTFLDCLSQPGLDERSERFQAIQLREALTDSMPALAQAGLAHRLKTTPEMLGAELIATLLADIETLIA